MCALFSIQSMPSYITLKSAGRAGARSWGKLALHCEIYSIAQLRRIYDVHSLELCYDPEFVCDHSDDDPDAYHRPDLPDEHCDAVAEAPPRVWTVQSHPFDSGADLKSQLQTKFGEEWGLSATERGRDRYDCLLGWELLPAVLRENPSESVSLCGKGSPQAAVPFALRELRAAFCSLSAGLWFQCFPWSFFSAPPATHLQHHREQHCS